MERKRTNSKSPGKRRSKKNTDKTLRRTESSSKVKASRTISSEETSSDEMVIVDQNQIKQSLVYDKENNQKVESIKSGKKNIKPSSSKMLERHSSKKNEKTSKRTESNKPKSSKRMISSEETSSDEVEKFYEYHRKNSRAFDGENKRKVEPINLQKKLTKKLSSSKLSEQQSSKKNETSKRILSSEETSSEELVIDNEKLNPSHDSNREINRKIEPIKIEKLRIRPSSSKLSEKQHPSKKKLVETSRRAKSYKGETCKRASEESLSGEFVKANVSHVLHDHQYTLDLSEDNRHEEPLWSLEIRSSPSKSPEKNFTENTEETLQSVRWSDRRALKKVNYCEDSSPDESASDLPRVHLNARGTGGDNKSKKAPRSLRRLSNKHKKGNRFNKISDSSDTCSNKLHFGVIEESNYPNSDKFLNEPTNTEISTGSPIIYESTNTSPFSLWGKNTKARQNLEDEECRKDNTDVKHGPSAWDLPKENVDKEFEKFKARKLQDNKEARKFQIINTERSSFHRASNRLEGEPGCSWFHSERNNSKGNVGYRKDGTELDTCSQNASKVVNKDAVKTGLISSRNDDNEPGCSLNYQSTDAFKFSRLVSHPESEMKQEKYGSRVENEACALNAPNALNEENVKKESENKKGLIKQPNNKGSNIFKIDNAVPGSSSLSDWWKNAFMLSKATVHSTGDMENKKECTEVEGDLCELSAPNGVEDSVEKETKEIKVLEGESKDLGISQMDDAEHASSFHYQRKDVFKSIKPKRHSDGSVEHKKGGTEPQDGPCPRNSPKSDNIKEDSEKECLKKLRKKDT